MYINKGKYGWYTTATNYKDKEDKAYVNLYFPKDTEPMDGTEQINPIEWKLTSYKGKVGMTVFKYTLIEKQDNEVKVEPSELPFY